MKDVSLSWANGIAWTATMLGGLAIIWVDSPLARFFADSGQPAWTVVLLLLPSLTAAYSLGRHRAQDDAATELANLAHDAEMLDDLLGRWAFDANLCHSIINCGDDRRIEVELLHELYESIRSWQTDPRTPSDERLREALEQLLAVAQEYQGRTMQYMWVADSGPGTPTDPRYYQVPIEWPDEKKYHAIHEISEARLALADALRNMSAARDEAARRMRQLGNEARARSERA